MGAPKMTTAPPEDRAAQPQLLAYGQLSGNR